MLIKIIVVLFGAVLGVLCALVSLVVGGAGHGWTSAWPFGLMSLILFPLAFYGLANYKKSSGVVTTMMLALALTLDVGLYVVTADQGLSYFVRAGSGAWLWIGIWSVWQIAVVATACLAPAAQSHRVG